MSEHEDEKPGDVVSVLLALNRRLFGEMRGNSGNPARTAFVRVAVLLVVLMCAGPILWQALIHMPHVLMALVGLFVTFRLVRWYIRRQP